MYLNYLTFSNEVIKVNQINETAKRDLSHIIKKLNVLLEENTYTLFDKANVQELQELYNKKIKELEVSQKIKEKFKSQYESLTLKFNEYKMNKNNKLIGSYPMQIELEKLQKENKELLLQIQNIKQKNNKQTKEIENIHNNQKYTKKINRYINEVSSLSKFKYEYYQKLKQNKNSIENEKKELKVAENMLDKIKNEKLINKQTLEWMNILKQDLQGTVDEIIQRIEQGKTQIFTLNENKPKYQSKKQNNLSIPNVNNKMTNHIPINNSALNPKIPFIPKLKRNKSNFNFYIKNDNSSNKQAIALRRSGSTILNPIHSKNNFNISAYASKYSNDNFKELLNKKGYYSEMNSRLELSLLNLSKNYNRKVNDLSICINKNEEKLNTLIQHNDILKNEVENLNQIYTLTKEKTKLTNELQPTIETKTPYSNNININTNLSVINNIEQSASRNDLLKELNNFKSEEEKTKSRNVNNVNNIIQQTNPKQSDILFTNTKNQKDLLEIRRQKLNEIKNRYLFTPIESSDSTI